MNTNKVHDPANMKCERNWNMHSSSTPPCTCSPSEEKHYEDSPEKKLLDANMNALMENRRLMNNPMYLQEAPTSVTGDELRERLEKQFKYASFMSHKDPIYGDENYLQYLALLTFIKAELLAQRTHIKQALLGRLEEARNNWGCNDATGHGGCDHSCSLFDDFIKLINEELA